jgi:pantothenate synthetase
VSAALKFLELVDAEDRPTDALRALASCPEEEYKQLLEQTIRTAYASDFENIDPTVDPQQKIVDTFKRYTPKSQHSRQVMLLLGLCREAGMAVVDAPRERKMQQRGKTNRTTAQPRQASGSTASRTMGQPAPGVPPQISGLLFGVTEDDIAVLNEKDFDEVWSALGKVAKARAKATRERLAVQQSLGTWEAEQSEE